MAPHPYCGQDIPATGDCHQHNLAKALLAGFRSKSISFYNPAPSAISSVAETIASYCSNDPLIFGCGAVHRSKALLHRVRSLREYRCAFVAVLSNTHLCCVARSGHGVGCQWCAGHAGWSQTLRKLVVLTFVLFADEKLDCSLPLPQCRAPPQIGVIAGVWCFQVP